MRSVSVRFEVSPVRWFDAGVGVSANGHSTAIIWYELWAR